MESGFNLDGFIDALADRVADKLAERLAPNGGAGNLKLRGND